MEQQIRALFGVDASSGVKTIELLGCCIGIIKQAVVAVEGETVGGPGGWHNLRVGVTQIGIYPGCSIEIRHVNLSTRLGGSLEQDAKHRDMTRRNRTCHCAVKGGSG